MKLRIEVTHVIDAAQFKALVEAIRPPEPVVEEKPVESMSPEIAEFIEALRAKNFDDVKTQHLRNALKVVMGQRKCPPEFTRSVLRDHIAAEGLPIPSGY